MPTLELASALVASAGNFTSVKSTSRSIDGNAPTVLSKDEESTLVEWIAGGANFFDPVPEDE